MNIKNVNGRAIVDPADFTPNQTAVSKYLRILSLNRIQFNRFKTDAGRNNVTKPSGTGKGYSRHARAVISGRGQRVTNINIAVGGARGYHDRLVKRSFKLNKKEKKIAIASLLVKNINYSNSIFVTQMPNFADFKTTHSEIYADIKKRSSYKVDRAYSAYRKACVVVHTDTDVHLAYKKKPGFKTVNVKSGENYGALELYPNSKHYVIFTDSAINTIRTNF